MRILNTYYEDVPPSNVLTPEEILELCCEVVPVDECSEVGKVTPYEGADQSDIDKDAALEQARADNPGKRILSVQIEDVGRPGKPCGEQHETWQDRLNCCDEVPQIYFDKGMTPEVLPAGGEIYIFASGGIPPYTFRTTSHATSFPDGRRDWTTIYPVALLSAGPTFCGLTAIYVTDGCSTDNMEIRSDIGEWYPLSNPCVLAGYPAVYGDIPGVSYYTAEAVSGRYKTSETQQIGGGEWSFGYSAVRCSDVISGGCGTGYYCAPCPDGLEDLEVAYMRACYPGIEPGASRPCLEAGVEAGISLNQRGIITHSGVDYEWVADAGFNTEPPCAGGQAYVNKQYVGKGPSNPQSWEWGC